MPRGKKATGRSSTGSSGTRSAKQQSALSFAGRVTKSNASQRAASGKKADEKAALLERSVSAAATPTESQAEDSDVAAEITAADETPATAELAIREQAREVAAEPRTAEEERAERVSEAQIKKYWAGKEAERTTRRVHQEGMGLHEKVLREFDMSSQYGPCIGVARVKRWKLAYELGLNPPIEVLATLIKDDKAGSNIKVQRAVVDELMSSQFVID